MSVPCPPYASKSCIILPEAGRDKAVKKKRANGIGNMVCPVTSLAGMQGMQGKKKKKKFSHR
jgi:hypothetical protein